jgi:hypothetical protein
VSLKIDPIVEEAAELVRAHRDEARNDRVQNGDPTQNEHDRWNKELLQVVKGKDSGIVRLQDTLREVASVIPKDAAAVFPAESRLTQHNTQNMGGQERIPHVDCGHLKSFQELVARRRR